MTVEEALERLLREPSAGGGPVESRADVRETERRERSEASVVIGTFVQKCAKDRTRDPQVAGDARQDVLERLLATRPRRLQALAQARAEGHDWLRLVDSAAWYGASDTSIARALDLDVLPGVLQEVAAEARARRGTKARAFLAQAARNAVFSILRKAGAVEDPPPSPPGPPEGAISGPDGQGEDEDDDLFTDDQLKRLRHRHAIRRATSWLDQEGLAAFAAWQESRRRGSSTARLDTLKLLETCAEANLRLVDVIRAEQPGLAPDDEHRAIDALYQRCANARKALISFIEDQRGDLVFRNRMAHVLRVIDTRYRLRKVPS